jgi:hypothetical protein
MRALTAFAAITVALLAAGPALAQPAPAAPAAPPPPPVVGPAAGGTAPGGDQPAPAAAPKATVQNQGGVEHITFTEAAVVTAEVQKPTVFLIIDHDQLGNYQWQSLKQDFLPKILATVQQDPF